MNFLLSHSTAVPGSAHDARTRPVPNHTAPVDAGSCIAVESAGFRAKAGRTSSGGPDSSAGIAGMAGPAGAGHPGTSSAARWRADRPAWRMPR